MIIDFQIFFTDTHNREFVVKLLKIPSLLHCVATLLCEVYVRKNRHAL